MGIFKRTIWEPISVRHHYFYRNGAIPNERGEPVTRVLYRNQDGRTKTERLMGHWTLEEVKGEVKGDSDV